jgi:poly-gamma-glutamate capsule biosynthesis protein CapA/YwtB (metallophosphatase superfamily)
MGRSLATIFVAALVAGACAPVMGQSMPEVVASSPSATTTSIATAAVTTSTTTTTRAPTTTTTTTVPPKGRLVVSGAGDTNLDPDYIVAFRSDGYGHAFTGLQDVFLADDLSIVNLECAAATSGRPVKSIFNFNCDVAALPFLREAGVEVANLANNHSGDFGVEALLETRANVEAAGMVPVGVGADRTQAHRPAIFDVNGWRVAVLGFGGIIPWDSWIATEDHPGMASGDDTDAMVAAVRAADEIADLVFVSIHWGVELDTTPRQDDVERAKAMIDAGADGIFGHHPHRLQPLEFYAGKPIAWSLGNFVWPRLSDAGATTAVAQFIVEPDGSISACLIPTFIESDGHPVLQVDYQSLCVWD